LSNTLAVLVGHPGTSHRIPRDAASLEEGPGNQSYRRLLQRFAVRLNHNVVGTLAFVQKVFMVRVCSEGEAGLTPFSVPDAMRV
jgi:hypothetical protein